MYCVVPLAGPDFYHASYGVKPFIDVGGEALIVKTLCSRPWLRSGEIKTHRIIFVLRETPHTADAQARLAALFPACRFVILSCVTTGALLSAAAGTALIDDWTAPLAVDLVDLIYDADFSPQAVFSAADRPAGLIPYFESSDSAYSYLRLDGDTVIETAEKQVISNHASAGTYFFDSTARFMQAVIACARDPYRFAVKGNLFVCPAFNPLIERRERITAVAVTNVTCYSKQFHLPAGN